VWRAHTGVMSEGTVAFALDRQLYQKVLRGEAVGPEAERASKKSEFCTKEGCSTDGTETIDSAARQSSKRKGRPSEKGL